MKTTNIFERNLDALIDPNIRLIINYGGSSSSKTISIMQLLLLYALKNKNKRITILGETLPKVRRTVLKDFQKIVLPQDDLNHLTLKYFNKTELIYSLPNGSELMFLSADAENKIHGMRTDILYVDEVNHVKQAIFDQLNIRTKHKVFVSFNPSSKFYIFDEFDRKDVCIIHSTYMDNPFVDKKIIKELKIKSSKNKNFKRVYLEGIPGVLEGLIFEEDINYEIVDKKPELKIKQVVYGLDFGFNDPSVLVKISVFEDKNIYIEEMLYKRGLTPDTMVYELNKLNLGHTRIMADSARPELIEHLYRKKLNVFSVKKTKIIDGINKMLDYHMYIDKNSKNLIEELRNYSWAKDKYDNMLEQPIDDYNHIIDAIRYAQTRINQGSKMIIL